MKTPEEIADDCIQYELGHGYRIDADLTRKAIAEAIRKERNHANMSVSEALALFQRIGETLGTNEFRVEDETQP